GIGRHVQPELGDLRFEPRPRLPPHRPPRQALGAVGRRSELRELPEFCNHTRCAHLELSPFDFPFDFGLYLKRLTGSILLARRAGPYAAPRAAAARPSAASANVAGSSALTP